MDVKNKKIQVVFFRSEQGNEPVRNWLTGLTKADKTIIGEDIKTIQYGWPIGMPLVKHVYKGIWEIRSNLQNKKIARVLFFMDDSSMILIHAFIKKTNKIPKMDLKIANDRKRQYSKLLVKS